MLFDLVPEWLREPLWTGIGALFMFLINKRKELAATRTSELDNVEKAVSIWRNMTVDLENRLQSMQAEQMQLRQLVVGLQIENAKLKQKLSQYINIQDESEK